jgi:YgiT-type zinc finger domain-containing protein
VFGCGRAIEIGEAAVKETMINTTVIYTLEHGGKLVVVEHVPARVCVETGEQFFAPETVEHLQSLIEGENTPARVIETPVYEYA